MLKKGELTPNREPRYLNQFIILENPAWLVSQKHTFPTIIKNNIVQKYHIHAGKTTQNLTEFLLQSPSATL